MVETLSKDFLVDFEGFGTSYIKEFAIYDFQKLSARVFFLKTPVPSDKKTLKMFHWLTKFFHHIPLSFGKTHFFKILNILRKPGCVFYIKGKEKQKFLKKLTLNSVINLENFGCPSFNSLPDVSILCFFHKKHITSHCALRKLFQLLFWYNEQRKSGNNKVSLSLQKEVS